MFLTLENISAVVSGVLAICRNESGMKNNVFFGIFTHMVFRIGPSAYSARWRTEEGTELGRVFTLEM